MVAGRNVSGRVTKLRVEGLVPAEVSGQDLRTIVGRTLGWQHIKSTAFELRRSGSGFRFSGHGSGHGVGLCVIGSAGLAKRGVSAERILERYFPGLKVSDGEAAARPEPEAPAVVVMVPEGDAGEREVLRRLAVRSRDALARDLDLVAPSRITLRFHPTVESYQRTTGQSWLTAAATHDRDIHFVPLSVLRQRGALEATIRHELVHVLTEPAFAGRPLWVREGAAEYFSGERSDRDRVADTACPTDRDLRRPASREALAVAYRRAAGCFAAQIDSGRTWSEVR